MKEKLYTIPLNDAINANDECPFCYIERNVEQDLLDFVLGSGSSYMESDVREATDKAGFCRNHFKKMFDYGNTLGNGWILKTHFEHMNREMKATILMVTHDAYSASYASRVLFLKDARLFNELLRGERGRPVFYHELLDVLAALGGDVSDVI